MVKANYTIMRKIYAGLGCDILDLAHTHITVRNDHVVIQLSSPIRFETTLSA